MARALLMAGAAIEFLLIPPSFLVNSRLPNFVIQNDIGSAVAAGELDPALICDLSNADNMLRAASRAPNDAAIRAHVDFSVPYVAKVRR
jgi:hypothetical protein